MATFTWQSAVSGSWATDVLWAGGVAPNDAAAAVALSPVGTDTVAVPSNSKFGVASVNGAAGVTLSVAGTLSIANALTAGTTVIEAGGEIRAATANAFLQVQKGTITNAGTLSAAGTGTYLFLNNTNLTNFSTGVLTGGTYSATGQVQGGSVATIDFARAGGAAITTASATGAVQNDDTSLAIAAAASSSPEGTGTGASLTFTVTRSGDLSRVHTVQWAAAGTSGSGTSPANAADFIGAVLPAGTIAFAAGEAS